VRALTAQARLSGIILGLLPIGFFGFLLLTSRREMLDAIATPIGGTALSVGLGLELVAFAWIRHLLQVR
jgi:tight adherence protein B